MTIDEAIKCLTNAKAEGVKSIILAYWEAGMFEREKDVEFLDDKDWEATTYFVEGGMDWSNCHEDIQFFIGLEEKLS